jgi:hypothetical protein
MTPRARRWLALLLGSSAACVLACLNPRPEDFPSNDASEGAAEAPNDIDTVPDLGEPDPPANSEPPPSPGGAGAPDGGVVGDAGVTCSPDAAAAEPDDGSDTTAPE